VTNMRDNSSLVMGDAGGEPLNLSLWFCIERRKVTEDVVRYMGK
jgi:hypothetical protein